MIFFPNLVLFLWNLHACASHFSQNLGGVFAYSSLSLLISNGSWDPVDVISKCLSNIPSSLSLQTLTVIHATVISIPGYCHWLLFGLPTFIVASLHSILHTVVRVICLKYRSDISLPYLCPSIASHGSQDRSQILGWVYKVFHWLAPSYLSSSACSSPNSTALRSSQATPSSFSPWFTVTVSGLLSDILTR